MHVSRKSSAPLRLKNRRSGTTLIEVVLAATILAMMAVIAISALTYPTHLVMNDIRRQIALQEGNRDLEYVTSLPCKEITQTNYSITILNKPFTLIRTVTGSSVLKNISIEIQNENAESVVDLVTEKTP